MLSQLLIWSVQQSLQDHLLTFCPFDDVGNHCKDWGGYCCFASAERFPAIGSPKSVILIAIRLVMYQFVLYVWNLGSWPLQEILSIPVLRRIFIIVLNEIYSVLRAHMTTISPFNHLKGCNYLHFDIQYCVNPVVVGVSLSLQSLNKHHLHFCLSQSVRAAHHLLCDTMLFCPIQTLASCYKVSWDQDFLLQAFMKLLPYS